MCSHDRKLSRGAALAAQRTLGSWLPTQQFGVTIEWIADHHQVRGCEYIIYNPVDVCTVKDK
jgi:hypothetical protein